MIPIILYLVTLACIQRWELRESRRWQLRFAERIWLAHEVLANRAERKTT